MRPFFKETKYIRELIAFGALNDTIENEDITICLGLEDENVLVEGLFDVQDLPDLQGHGLTRPLGRDLAEPTI